MKSRYPTFDESAAGHYAQKMEMALGIQQSATAQEARLPGWSDAALGYLRRYLSNHWSPFTVEHFREFAERYGLPVPVNGSAYGNVFQRASRDGLIRLVGYQPARRGAAHKRPLRLWKSA